MRVLKKGGLPLQLVVKGQLRFKLVPFLFQKIKELLAILSKRCYQTEIR